MNDPEPADPAATERRPYHHGDLRRALVEAGLAILREEGLASLTLRAIAARVGVSHAAPRRHFPSLEALQAAIAAEGFRMHARAMREGVGPASTREERLRVAMRGYVGFALREPELFALMFATMREKPDDPERAAAATASYAVLAEVSRGLVWPGAEGPNRQERTEAMLWSFVHGFAALAEAGQMTRAVGLPCGPGRGTIDPDAVIGVMPAFRYQAGV